MRKSYYTKGQTVTIAMGVVLSALSFACYFLLGLQWLNCLLAVLCLLQTLYLMYVQLGKGEEFTKKERVLYPTLLLVIFYACLLAFLAWSTPLGSFCFDYVLWTLYCGSSLIPLFYIIMILLSYAF